MLSGKTIILGVTGGIAAYKSVNLASRLSQYGAKVKVVMTEAATEFVTPLTFSSVTGIPAVTSNFSSYAEGVIHISLAEGCDIVVVAPATANIIAKVACGIADDTLTCIILATRAPIVFIPSMHSSMFSASVVQENIERLKRRGCIVVEPEYGRLATGGIGVGRFPKVKLIVDSIDSILNRKKDLLGKRIVVTAGGTREPIDPVRYIGNYSSGKMGYAVAEAARDRGAEVTLIAASVILPDPIGMSIVHVKTSKELEEAVKRATRLADVLIMAAAVADYRPKRIFEQKLKRGSKEELVLKLVRTADILSGVSKEGLIKVGFAAESESLVDNAYEKLVSKGLDMIVANDITSKEGGFGSDMNKATILYKEGSKESLPNMLKRDLAEVLLNRMVQFYG